MTERDQVRTALADEWDRYIAPGGGKRDYITPDLIDRTIKALRDHLPTRPNPDMAGCICCANGNDIPDGEYCRACGREGKTTPLGAAVMRARGKDGPPSAPVQFDSPALPPTLNSGATTEECANCRYFRLGECHLNPPSRLPRKFDSSANAGYRVRDEELIWGWPLTGPKNWCGQFLALSHPQTEQK